ncbi:unnamed protein product [Paramecium primaurelia]|uniref:Uncharacterized protein n=1 Tax=Paramecium primaurelia TaxID=5886 RepID=A0A8S1KN66_PARPR|nr:unnamed protein product [Paramecium primaurelia]
MYSYMDWDGLKSKKWKDKGRKKFEQQAIEIITPRESDVFLSQVQTKLQNPLIQNQLENLKTPIIKQSLNNQESYRLEKFYSEPNFRKQFEPLNRQIYFEKKHLRLDKDGHLEDLDYGIKTFEQANKETQQGYILEDEMQRKVRVNDHRNGIGTHFLGDKAYHIPEYSSNFYKHPDGAIPGSNIQYRHQYKQLSK